MFLVFRRYNRRAFSSSSSLWKVDNHYETLGVSRDATPEAIKDAYYKLMKAHHSDVSSSSDAKDRSAAINIAYTALKSPDDRKALDEKLLWEKQENDRKVRERAAAAARKLEVQRQKEAERARAEQAARSSTTKSGKKSQPVHHAYNEADVRPISSTREGSPRPSPKPSTSSYVSGQRPTIVANKSRMPPKPKPKPKPQITPIYVPGQPPTSRDRQRQVLEASNVSRELFPQNDDPCRGLGTWQYKGSNFLPTFVPLPGVTRSTWYPAYLLANQKLITENSENISLLMFPEGNDPCKGVGVWTATDPAHWQRDFEFKVFPGVTRDVALESLHRAERILCERYDQSAYGFPNGDNPCKGYGWWTKYGSFVPFNNVPKTTWMPLLKKAPKFNRFAAQRAANEASRTTSPTLWNLVMSTLLSPFRPQQTDKDKDGKS